MKVNVIRPNWDEYFFSFAMLASIKSPDAETQHGCIIVNDKHHIVGVGYNGFPPGIDDSDYDNTRSKKYPFIIHAESNSIYNMENKANNLTAYITGKPCIECLKALYANNIRIIKYLNRRGSIIETDKEYADNWNKLVKDMKIDIKVYEIDIQWLSLAQTKYGEV